MARNPDEMKVRTPQQSNQSSPPYGMSSFIHRRLLLYRLQLAQCFNYMEEGGWGWREGGRGWVEGGREWVEGERMGGGEEGGREGG